MTQNNDIILASKSTSRADILKTAGIPFRAIDASVDEGAFKKAAEERGLTPSQIALGLAGQKAQAVSNKNPNDYVLGADQILVCRGEMFDKPKDMAAAKATLMKLSGQTHTLISAAAIYLDGNQVFEAVEEAHLTMQDLTDEFLEDYLTRAGEKVLTSVGAYQLEAEGADLFTKIEGDFFTVLGLPLIPIQTFLRSQGL